MKMYYVAINVSNREQLEEAINSERQVIIIDNSEGMYDLVNMSMNSKNPAKALGVKGLKHYKLIKTDEENKEIVFCSKKVSSEDEENYYKKSDCSLANSREDLYKLFDENCKAILVQEDIFDLYWAITMNREGRKAFEPNRLEQLNQYEFGFPDLKNRDAVLVRKS
jgi:hypothetical protein